MKLSNVAALVFASIVVVVAGVLASVAVSDGSSGGGSSCNNSDWAGTASGKPKALSASGVRSFYVWRDGRQWHLWVRGATQSAPLAGQVAANAPLRVVTSSGLRPSLSAGARKLTLRTSAGRLAGVDFIARCASRLGFKLTPGRTPASIFLGALGRAPASTFRLDRPASTGVTGRILLISACPVGGGNCPPPKPTKGTVRIETVTGKGGGGGQLVTHANSDESGNFSAEIPSGHYQLTVETRGGYPVPKPSLVTVESGVMTQANVYLDSGIR